MPGLIAKEALSLDDIRFVLDGRRATGTSWRTDNLRASIAPDGNMPDIRGLLQILEEKLPHAGRSQHDYANAIKRIRRALRIHAAPPVRRRSGIVYLILLAAVVWLAILFFCNAAGAGAPAEVQSRNATRSAQDDPAPLLAEDFAEEAHSRNATRPPPADEVPASTTATPLRVRAEQYLARTSADVPASTTATPLRVRAAAWLSENSEVHCGEGVDFLRSELHELMEREACYRTEGEGLEIAQLYSEASREAAPSPASWHR